jgi:hypothetical protein
MSKFLLPLLLCMQTACQGASGACTLLLQLTPVLV